MRFPQFSSSRNSWLVLCFILAIALFLRTTHFTDWLRFNDDQARDASIIDSMIAGENIPLLGPKAGGTGFYLGPAFYYIEYISAFLFGNTPQSLAYPALLSSLGFLVLYFVLARKIFSPRVALATLAVLAVSFFAIKYSRFAWNPNLVPFFSLLFLYCLERILSLRERAPWHFIILLGISLGIGVQLHSTLLLILPLIFVATFGYAWRKKLPIKKLFLTPLFIALFFSTPMLISEIKNHGENTAAFFRGLATKTGKDDTWKRKIKTAGICLTQGNTIVLSTLSFNDDCDLLAKKYRKSWDFWPRVIGEILFFVGGVFLFFRFLLREKDEEKCTLLIILFTYFTLFSLSLIPIGGEATPRFLITIMFIPFLLFGLWLEYFFEKGRALGWIILGLSLAILVTLNLSTYIQVYSNQRQDISSNYFGGNRLEHILPIAKAIAEDIKKSGDFTGHYWVIGWDVSRVVSYLAHKKGVATVEYTSFDTLRRGMTTLPITVAYIVKESDKIPEKSYFSNLDAFSIISETTIGKYTLIKIKPLQ